MTPAHGDTHHTPYIYQSCKCTTPDRSPVTSGRHHAVARRASGNTHTTAEREDLCDCAAPCTKLCRCPLYGRPIEPRPAQTVDRLAADDELPARYIAPRQMDLPFGSFPRSVSTTPPFRTSDCARRDESRPRRRRPVAALLSRHCVLSRDCRCGARPVLSQARGQLDRRDRDLSEPLT